MHTKTDHRLILHPCPSAISPRKFSKAKPIAARLGICSRTIFRWANEGKFARHKVNSRVVLFDEAEVIAFIEATKVARLR